MSKKENQKAVRRWLKANTKNLFGKSKATKKEAASWVSQNHHYFETAKKKDARVNTKAFWQDQSFGPASHVTRIDPTTGEVTVERVQQAQSQHLDKKTPDDH